MGSELDIVKLYKLENSLAESYLLAKTVRPRFSNANQSAEDAAIDVVDNNFDLLIRREKTRLGFSSVTLIGEWQDALPEDDIFYTSTKPIFLDIWFAKDLKHPSYFVFGSQSTEESFWQSIHELFEDGDVWTFDDVERPARREHVLYVQI